MNSGFNTQEQKVMDSLVDAYNGFLKLPVQHSTEQAELANAIHILQGILSFRILRRDYPKGWRCYKSE